MTLTGFDACCYRNDDLDRKEVRLELGWFRNKPERLSPDKITVREERPEEWFETEAMTRRAFWNRYRPGCDEHFLVHKLRSSPAYRPELSRVAVVDGRIVGCILYSESQIRDGAAVHPVLTFGPLCVDPTWQGRGIGERLLGETLPLAAGAGYPGVVIYGEPDYYPRLGFRPCGRFGITTPEGETSDAFMAIELVPGGWRMSTEHSMRRRSSMICRRKRPPPMTGGSRRWKTALSRPVGRKRVEKEGQALLALLLARAGSGLRLFLPELRGGLGHRLDRGFRIGDASPPIP